MIYNMEDDDTRIAAKIAINNYYLAGNDDARLNVLIVMHVGIFDRKNDGFISCILTAE